jgi:hypothetical protein
VDATGIRHRGDLVTKRQRRLHEMTPSVVLRLRWLRFPRVENRLPWYSARDADALLAGALIRLLSPR